MNKRFGAKFNGFRKVEEEPVPVAERMDDFQPTTLTPCATCVRRDEKDSLKCEAYPLGIPRVILEGENQHREPFAGDHGLQYKEKQN